MCQCLPHLYKEDKFLLSEFVRNKDVTTRVAFIAVIHIPCKCSLMVIRSTLGCLDLTGRLYFKVRPLLSAECWISVDLVHVVHASYSHSGSSSSEDKHQSVRPDSVAARDLAAGSILLLPTVFGMLGNFPLSLSFFKHLYWSIIALHCCVSFCCITK